MTTQPSRAQRTPRELLVLAAKWAFMVIAVALLAWALARNWTDVREALVGIGWWPLILASLVASVALGFNALSWRAVMRAVGLNAPWRAAVSVFLISQPGKYVPGAVWPVLAQAEFAKQHHVSRARALTGSIVAMVMGVAMAGVVGALGIALATPGSLLDYWWALVVAGALVALMTPPLLHRLVKLAFRVASRTEEPATINGRALLECAGWSALNWVALGVHAWLLIKPLADSAPSLALATGAFALAWLVGFLVVLAPAGLGAREAALVVMLASVATQPQALAVALLSRFAMTIADAVGMLAGLAMRARLRP